MKKAKLISLLLLAMTTSKVFAYESTAHVCNKTVNTIFHFQLTYNYQANVIGEDSFQFDLKPEECHDIKYYMGVGDGSPGDDDLMFQDQNNKDNYFHIKHAYSPLDPDHREQATIYPLFDTPGYVMEDVVEGSWRTTTQDRGVSFSIFDNLKALHLPSGNYGKVCTNAKNDSSSRPNHIVITADCPDYTNYYTPGHYPQVVYNTKSFDYSQCKPGDSVNYIQGNPGQPGSGSLQGHFACSSSPDSDQSKINGAGILPWASSNSSLQKLKPFSNNGLNK